MRRVLIACLLVLLAVSLGAEQYGLPRKQATEREPYVKRLDFVKQDIAAAWPDPSWIQNLNDEQRTFGYPTPITTIADNTPNGVNLVCSTESATGDPNGAIQAGSWYLPAAVSGKSWYLVGGNVAAQKSGAFIIVDMLWYNKVDSDSNITQTITPSTLPARDMYGTSNGDGIFPVIWGCDPGSSPGGTLTYTWVYTDSDGNSGNSTTIVDGTNFYSVGTVRLFELKAGDRGARQFDSFIGTTTGAGGQLCLALVRLLWIIPSPRNLFEINQRVHNLKRTPKDMIGPIKLYDGTCLQVWRVSVTKSPQQAGTGETDGQTTFAGSLLLVEK